MTCCGAVSNPGFLGSLPVSRRSNPGPGLILLSQGLVTFSDFCRMILDSLMMHCSGSGGPAARAEAAAAALTAGRPAPRPRRPGPEAESRDSALKSQNLTGSD